MRTSLVVSSSAITLLVVALGVSGHPSGLSSQTADERPPIVGLKVTVDGGSPSRLRVQAGQQATVGRVGKGGIGMTPLVREGWIELVIVRLPEGGETAAIEELARLELRRGEVGHVDAGFMTLDIEWTELIPRTGADAGALAGGPCTQCCVFCEGEWHCACLVETVCGRCCCPDACVCPG